MVELFQILQLCDDTCQFSQCWRTADKHIFRVYSYWTPKRISSKLGTTRSKKPARGRSRNYGLLLNEVIKLWPFDFFASYFFFYSVTYTTFSDHYLKCSLKRCLWRIWCFGARRHASSSLHPRIFLHHRAQNVLSNGSHKSHHLWYWRIQSDIHLES